MMTPEEGQQRLRDWLGPSAHWRVNDRAPSRAEREAADDSILGLIDAAKAAEDARDARARWLLAQDQEYQRLASETTRLQSALTAARELALSPYRIETWRVLDGGDIYIEESGDDWADVIRKVQQYCPRYTDGS